MAICSISIEYEGGDEGDAFFGGDTITGRVLLSLQRAAKVECVMLRAKGRARVLWTESYGVSVHVPYCNQVKLLSMEKRIPVKGNGGGVLPAGTHVLPFDLQVPNMDLPPTFRGRYGEVVYFLEARVSRAGRADGKARRTFTLLSRGETDIPDIMRAQQRSQTKTLSIFGAGRLSINVHTHRMGYVPGENIEILADVINSSRRAVTPRFCLYEKQSFYAGGRRKVCTKELLKEDGRPVPSWTRTKLIKALQLPQHLTGTIFNCPILKREFRLKVILDVTLNRNAEVRLPIVVLVDPDGSVSEQLHSAEDGSFC